MMADMPERREWTAYYKHKYDEWHVAIPAEDAGWLHSLCPDGILPGLPKDYREQVAKRIVACVNALSGLSPEGVRDVIEALVNTTQLLECNVRTKSRDDAAEQEAIVSIRAALAKVRSAA